jgi:hypothetical protein
MVYLGAVGAALVADCGAVWADGASAMPERWMLGSSGSTALSAELELAGAKAGGRAVFVADRYDGFCACTAMADRKARGKSADLRSVAEIRRRSTEEIGRSTCSWVPKRLFIMPFVVPAI